ncbi:class II aldolase/adducin family protein [Marinospirillum sp.]|uniref:class II aldolase/adducin family protein n=1 Tax=Marinospirillum sp. TaxID=2183934 RepID=UPI00384BB7EB
MSSQQQEGVIQYACQLHKKKRHWPESLLEELNHWRNEMQVAGWIGQNPQRYQGLGFGNLSLRQPDPQEPDAFVITASQTGHLDWLDSDAWPWVIAADTRHNRVEAEGSQPPSSEALSHAALYQANPEIQAVIHGHAPDLWQLAAQQSLACTPENIPYGTPAMAEAIRQKADSSSGLVVMLGHQDGLLAWGRNLAEAAEKLYALQSNPGQ